MKNIINSEQKFTSYPIRFIPIIQERIWGGTKLSTILNKNLALIDNAGESWELSTVPGNISKISNGTLTGNSLTEALETYGKEILGQELHNEFGANFPLLIKFLHAKDDLSIQVHPDDTIAKMRHNCQGKTEMWYVIDAEKGSQIISGFSKKINKEEYITRVNNNTLPEVLDSMTVQQGDVFFIPTGRIHALGAGIVLAEIQQTSDITYRIYDYNRKDKNGKNRELHTDWALETIDFSLDKTLNKLNNPTVRGISNLAKCPFFTTNLIFINKEIKIDLSKRNSFTILIGVKGEGILEYPNGQEVLKIGETILLPAIMDHYKLLPRTTDFNVLEVYI